jgi:hypothetical protein
VGVRSYELMPDARRALRDLGPELGRRAAAVIAEMMDETVPLVRPGDFSVTRGPQVEGRRGRHEGQAYRAGGAGAGTRR